MKDIVLLCQNCQSEFVFSTGEQQFYAEKNLTSPKFCPICRGLNVASAKWARSIKHQEQLIPPKPSVITSPSLRTK